MKWKLVLIVKNNKLKIWDISVNHVSIVKLQLVYFHRKLKIEKLDEIKELLLCEKILKIQNNLEKNWKILKNF